MVKTEVRFLRLLSYIIMSLPIPYAIKRQLRVWDSRYARRRERAEFRGQSFEFYRTYWWGDASQKLIDDEIAPYFDALDGAFAPEVIIDAGAATGAFSVLAGKLHPKATIYCFEPSQRQRILLERNARLNGVEHLKVNECGLWDHSAVLSFRTNGAESSFESVSRFKGLLPFGEAVSVISLDEWVPRHHLSRIDLIKMDVEGAEIEILEGGRKVLAQFSPTLLIQAYHVRDNAPTFDRCSRILRELNYETSEWGRNSGLLLARKSS